jgi:hypothetical protein
VDIEAFIKAFELRTDPPYIDEPTQSDLIDETSEEVNDTQTTESTMFKPITPPMKSGGWSSKCNSRF